MSQKLDARPARPVRLVELPALIGSIMGAILENSTAGLTETFFAWMNLVEGAIEGRPGDPSKLQEAVRLAKSESPRGYWTDRELAKLITGIVGGLIHSKIVDVGTAKRTMRWLAEHSEIWSAMGVGGPSQTIRDALTRLGWRPRPDSS